MGIRPTAYLVYGIVLTEDIDENNAFFNEDYDQGVDGERVHELYPELDVYSIGLYDEENCYICVETYEGDYTFRGALPVITESEQKRYTVMFKQVCKTLGVEEQEPRWRLVSDLG